MPRTSYGTEKRDQSWYLVKLLLNARGTSPTQRVSIEGAEITYRNWNASSTNPSIDVKASLVSLSKLSSGRLNGEQIRETINEHLGEKFLGILRDNRTQKAGRGAEVWKFELNLWSTDLAQNYDRFLELWEQKKSSSGHSTSGDNGEERINDIFEPDKEGRITFGYLTSYLQPYEKLVQRLVATVEHKFSTLPAEKLTPAEWKEYALDIISEISGSKSTFLFIRKNKDEWREVTGFSSAESDIRSSRIGPTIIHILKKREVFSKYSHGRTIGLDGKTHIIIPLKSEMGSQSVVCICDVQKDDILLGEPSGEIISTFLSIDLSSISSSLAVEASILDGLKRTFSFVSPWFYERRFALFKDRLTRMTVNYQPIVKLDPLVLEAWEALARDPESMVGDDPSTMIAPVDLFEAAELWGVEFTTELDLYFLRKSAITYRQLRDAAKLQRFHDTLPLSINVYPSSILRSTYLDAVKEITANKTIPANKLILEVSEKSPLPEPTYWNDEMVTWKSFKHRLKRFVREVPGIKFAIDDFGVGHASVSRLVGLNLEYVKIDREVLGYAEDVRDKVIKFVLDTLIEAGNYSPHIIIEGVDKEYPIRLNTLLEIGAQSIQGYIVDKPGSQIYSRLRDDQYKLLHDQLT